MLTKLALTINCLSGDNETGSAGEEAYSEQRKQWGEERGVSWTPKNRRPEKMRDTLKECEVRN